jgi:hypothetical protein
MRVAGVEMGVGLAGAAGAEAVELELVGWQPAVATHSITEKVHVHFMVWSFD